MKKIRCFQVLKFRYLVLKDQDIKTPLQIHETGDWGEFKITHMNNFKGWDELLKKKYVGNIENALQ